MSDESPNVTYSPEIEQNSDTEIENNVSADSPFKEPLCIKLQLDDHIKAFIEKTDLGREFETFQCSSEIVDKVISNYIIAKQILSNLGWQEKLLCKQVCSTWHSAVQALSREHLGPVDFMMDLRPHSLTWAVLKRSSSFSNEPMIVMTYVNGSGLDMTCQCKLIEPSPCAIPCLCDHSLLDSVRKYTSAPKDCMNMIRSDYLSYMPLPNSITYQHAIFNLKVNPYMVGLFIPVIPDVKYHAINIKCIGNMQEDFYDVVRNISKERIFKGIIVYVTDKYLLQSVEDITFLNHFKNVQPDIPYAIGGCIIEDTIFEQSDIDGVIEGINAYQDFFSENLISISMFTVPKNLELHEYNMFAAPKSPEQNEYSMFPVPNSPELNEYNFNMYSLVLDSSCWSKPKIQQAIIEFSGRVPQFEHSAVVKLSCVGRDQKHKWEQDCFRAVFPNTRIVGCYGNGELGVDHPPKPDEPSPQSSAKRHCGDSGPQFGIVYSYSTVFVYMGWGKILSNRPA